MLADCAEEGLRLIEAHLYPIDITRFSPNPFIPATIRILAHIDDYLYSNNPDLFYSLLSVLCASDDIQIISEVISRKKSQENFARALVFIEQALYQESLFESDLTACIHRYALLSDDEIKMEFSSRFEAVPIDVLTLPTDRSVFLAKVNHGYWEFVRGAYDDAREQRDQFRTINANHMIGHVRTSGITQFWGMQINRHLLPEKPRPSNSAVSLCVNLTVGTETLGQSLNKNLNPVTRGAAIGLMSMFEAALPSLKQYTVGDSDTTRSLISKKRLEEFFEKYIADAEACLFVIPPHLKMIDFANYKGDVYKFIVPPTKIHHTWKAVAATLLGYLLRMSKKYRTITILAQGAAFASLMALLIADMEEAFPMVKLRFIDLGRVLDVTTPEILQRQSWAKHFLNEYIEEGNKVFRNAVSADFALAKAI